MKMNEYEQTLIETLTQMTEGAERFAPNAGFYTIHRYVLLHGRLWTPQPLPSRYKRREPRRCFQNSQELARRSKKLRYVEGFAYPAHPFLPVHHGWCVDEQDRVIDTTWVYGNDGLAYFGVAFEMPFVKQQLKGTSIVSVLDNIENGFQLLRKEAKSA